ncbi:MAG: DUF3025 domain-containing protein [Betaproteobacteria bacterium]|nr:DUF3025 domain-containing protein [Betaproteobacteria bacterium]
MGSVPIFDSIRPWLARLPRSGWPSHEALNALAEEAGVRTASGMPLRFVLPTPSDPYYEVHAYRSGHVATRPGNWHDLFNALIWLAFPRTKATINALHAAEIPREGGRRGRLRDMLTIFDEGGVIVLCSDPELESLIRGFRWRELFWDCRERVLLHLRLVVIGHAVLEKALSPWPGIACKALFVEPGGDLDAGAAAWLDAHAGNGTPQFLAPLPVFGYPGWLAESERAAFYDDERYFRPFKRVLPLSRLFQK